MSKRNGVFLARQIEQVKQRALVRSGRLLNHERTGRERRQANRFRRARGPDIERAPAAAAQIEARCDLPEPSGPISATALAGQSGQLSIKASAAELHGPDKKSSRA